MITDKDAKQLIADLCSIEGGCWVVGGEAAVSENFLWKYATPCFDGGYMALETPTWHIHLPLADVTEVQFVEAEDLIAPFLYYVRFSSFQGDTLLRLYFPNPYLDDCGQIAGFQPERLAMFEKYRDKYVGVKGIIYAKRNKSS